MGSGKKVCGKRKRVRASSKRCCSPYLLLSRVGGVLSAAKRSGVGTSGAYESERRERCVKEFEAWRQSSSSSPPPLALVRKYACVVLLTSVFFFFRVRQKNAGFSSDRQLWLKSASLESFEFSTIQNFSSFLVCCGSLYQFFFLLVWFMFCF